jgi:hypothetical protein
MQPSIPPPAPSELAEPKLSRSGSDGSPIGITLAADSAGSSPELAESIISNSDSAHAAPRRTGGRQ